MINEPDNLEEIEAEPTPAIDEESAARDERDWQILEWMERALHILAAYQSHQTGENNLRMSFRAWCLALGFKPVAGADGPAELAQKCGFDKQTVGKTVNHFIGQLSLSPLPGQRDLESRENMREARKSQL